jgi:uncharacterized cupin superfamily protein
MTSPIKLLRVSPSLEGKTSDKIAADRVISGAPSERLNNVFTNTKENFFCGVWESTTGKWNLSYTEDEFCYLIEGKAILTDSEGYAEHINPGDGFVIPAGYKGTWETIGSAKKFYSIYEAA